MAREVLWTMRLGKEGRWGHVWQMVQGGSAEASIPAVAEGQTLAY